MKNLPLYLMFVVSTSVAASPLNGLDINFNETEPREYEYCDKLISTDTTIPEAGRFEVFKACNYGLDDARRMAERFGGGNGQIEGYHRGYAYGLKEGYDMGSGDPVAYKQGQSSVDAVGQYLESGLQEGVNKGNQEGDQDGSSEARVRFHKAVDTGKFPSRDIAPTPRAYMPRANAYASLVPRHQQVPTSARQIIDQKDTKELESLQLKDFPVYSQFDASTWGEVRKLSWFELWYDNGMYTFSRDRYYDSNQAMNVWLQRPIDTKPRYQALQNINVLDTAGQRIDLQNVFTKAFKESYRYYVNYYFAKNFKRSVDMGQLHGKAVGLQIGKRTSFGQGLVAAFNKKYEDSARSTYINAYKLSFQTSFNTVFNDYANNPKLEILGMELVGMEDDGIIQPGEEVAVKFKMKNVGGVSAPLTATLTGEVLDSREMKGSIAPLSTKVIESGVAVATIDPRLESGENADLVLNVNGIKANYYHYVTKLVKLTGLSNVTTDALSGSVSVTVNAENVSTKATAASISAQLIVDGKIVAEANAGTLGAGARANLDLKLSNIDPMVLLDSSVNAKTVLKMGDTVLESRAVSFSTQNRTNDLVNYFGQLINNKGLIKNGASVEDRTTEVMKAIVELNRRELEANKDDGNIWKDSADKTIPGKLRANKQLANNSDAALKQYDKIARQMYQNKDILPQFLFFKAKKKAYIALLNTLVQGSKLKD